MSIPWGLLKAENRVKDINVSWSDEELHAIYELKIDPELVRKGVLTLEEAEVEKNEPESKNDKMIRSMNKEELKTLATELGIEVPEDAKRVEIISLIHKSKLPANDIEERQESLE